MNFTIDIMVRKLCSSVKGKGLLTIFFGTKFRNLVPKSHIFASCHFVHCISLPFDDVPPMSDTAEEKIEIFSIESLKRCLYLTIPLHL